MFKELKWYVNYCQNLCTLARGTVYVVLYNRVVENAVALFQGVGLFTIHNLYFTLHHVDKLLALVVAQLEVGVLLGVNVNYEWLHVATSLLLCQWVILHVLTCISSAVAKADAAILLTIFGATNNRSKGIVIIHKGT